MIAINDNYLSALKLKYKLDPASNVREFSTAADITPSDDGYKFTARIASNCIDRDDEVCLPSGADLSMLKKTGAIYWNHAWMNDSGAKPVALIDPNSFVQTDDYIECQATFLKRPTDYQGDFDADFARTFVNQAKAAGIFTGVSVGFQSLEERNPTKKDIGKYGQSLTKVYSKWRPMEFSITPMQSNPGAYITAIGKGLMTRDIVTKAGIVIPEPKPVEVKSVESKSLIVVLPRKKIDLTKAVDDAVGMAVAKYYGRSHY